MHANRHGFFATPLLQAKKNFSSPKWQWNSAHISLLQQRGPPSCCALPQRNSRRVPRCALRSARLWDSHLIPAMELQVRAHCVAAATWAAELMRSTTAQLSTCSTIEHNQGRGSRFSPPKPNMRRERVNIAEHQSPTP